MDLRLLGTASDGEHLLAWSSCGPSSFSDLCLASPSSREQEGSQEAREVWPHLLGQSVLVEREDVLSPVAPAPLPPRHPSPSSQTRSDNPELPARMPPERPLAKEADDPPLAHVEETESAQGEGPWPLMWLRVLGLMARHSHCHWGEPDQDWQMHERAWPHSAMPPHRWLSTQGEPSAASRQAGMSQGPSSRCTTNRSLRRYRTYTCYKFGASPFEPKPHTKQAQRCSS